MAFNFGAFIGGASDNLVEMIKTKEAQLYKEEQDEKEEKNTTNHKLVLFLASSKHKIKKKAEQAACKEAYNILNACI